MMSSINSISKMQPDLLLADSFSAVSHLPRLNDAKAMNDIAAYKKDLQAPKHMTTNRNDHELLAEHSRMRRTVANVIDERRSVAGNAYAEHFIRELQSAFQINRGPPGPPRKTMMQTGGPPGRSMMMGQAQGTYMGVPNVASQAGSAHQQAVSMLHQSFKNPNWPPNFITPDNVLDYFCDPGNVFYDVSSCNQHIKMQNLNRPLHECLQSMQGIQYTVVGAFPPLYVILKQRRNSPTNVTPLAYYYIVNGTVYQCPDVYTYVQSKLIGIVDPLRQALEQARQFSRYNIAKGYYWEFKDSDGETVKKAPKEDEKPQLARSTFYQRTRTDQMLRELFAKFPPPDNISKLQEFNFGENEMSAEHDAATAASGVVEKTTQGASTVNQDITATENGPSTSGVGQQPAFTSPSSVPLIPTQQNTGECSGGPLSFPGTAPVLGAPDKEADTKRFKAS